MVAPLYKKMETLAVLGLALAAKAVQSCPVILLETGDTIDQGDTLFDADGRISLVQQFGGNLQVYRGEPGDLDCLIWESGVCEVPVDSRFLYRSRLQRDGNLVTVKRDSTGALPLQFPFSAGIALTRASTYYFILTCDGVVGIYDNTFFSATNPTPYWSEQGNLCDLSEGPPPSTTCNRTVLMKEGQDVRTDRPLPDIVNGAYIQQLRTGEVVVNKGNPASPGETLWRSCSGSNPVGEYLTQLQDDSQFITRLISDRSQIAWKRDAFTPNLTGPWELALECEGNDYGSLVISDPTGRNVQWSSDLRQGCGEPVCPTATLLLGMNENVRDAQVKVVQSTANQYYTLQQVRTGALRLWRGRPLPNGNRNELECVVWQSDAPVQAQEGAEAYTRMQNDGNLVTYFRRNADGFRPIWDTETSSGMGSFSFVIDDCSFATPVLAVYMGNPINDSDARVLWSVPFNDSCPAPQRGLRGDKDADEDNEDLFF